MDVSQNPKKKQIKRKIPKKVIVKLTVCIVLFVGCTILKYQEHRALIPVWSAVSKSATDGVDYQSAMHSIGQAMKEKDALIPVFKDVFFDLFFISEDEMKNENVTPVVNAADLSVELLSFEMSEAELQDDSSAGAFLLPGATANTTIKFPHTTPLYGVVTSPFGYRQHPILKSRSFHTGIDIAGAMGAEIGAFADGEVIEVGYNQVYGNYILVLHTDDYRSFYGHASKIVARKGDMVTIGQTIAEVGTTGLSTGPHLHFEVRKNKTRLDPMLFVVPNA